MNRIFKQAGWGLLFSLLAIGFGYLQAEPTAQGEETEVTTSQDKAPVSLKEEEQEMEMSEEEMQQLAQAVIALLQQGSEAKQTEVTENNE